MITLKQSINLMNKINKSNDYISYIDNGKMVVESRVIIFGNEGASKGGKNGN